MHLKNRIIYSKTYTLATNVFLQTVDETLKTCPVVVSIDLICALKREPTKTILKSMF